METTRGKRPTVMTMKTSLTAISAVAALSLGMVATGCGGDDNSRANAGTDSASAGRQAAAGPPGPAECGTTGIEAEATRVKGAGISYISCVDQPVTIWAADVDNFDWATGGRPDKINGRGPGTTIAPSTFVLSGARCYGLANSWGWRIGVTLDDGSRASVRAQIPECLTRGWWTQTRFNAVDGPTSVVLTTDSGKRVKLTAKDRNDVQGLQDPRRFFYTPIFIEAA